MKNFILAALIVFCSTAISYARPASETEIKGESKEWISSVQTRGENCLVEVATEYYGKPLRSEMSSALKPCQFFVDAKLLEPSEDGKYKLTANARSKSWTEISGAIFQIGKLAN